MKKIHDHDQDRSVSGSLAGQGIPHIDAYWAKRNKIAQLRYAKTRSHRDYLRWNAVFIAQHAVYDALDEKKK